MLIVTEYRPTPPCTAVQRQLHELRKPALNPQAFHYLILVPYHGIFKGPHQKTEEVLVVQDKTLNFALHLGHVQVGSYRNRGLIEGLYSLIEAL